MTTGDPAIDVIVDGGDKACGELLMELHRQLRDCPPGTRVRLLALDPAAPIDIPAWCHLTGHIYGGRVAGADTPSYDIEVGSRTRATNQQNPWQLVDATSLNEVEPS